MPVFLKVHFSQINLIQNFVHIISEDKLRVELVHLVSIIFPNHYICIINIHVQQNIYVYVHITQEYVFFKVIKFFIGISHCKIDEKQNVYKIMLIFRKYFTCNL